MKRPERPAPAELVREARRCEGEAAYWASLAQADGLSVPFLVHATGRAGHWREQAQRWEAAARAACSGWRWALWCRRHRLPATWRADDRGGVAWPERPPSGPERAPVSPDRRYY